MEERKICESKREQVEKGWEREEGKKEEKKKHQLLIGFLRTYELHIYRALWSWLTHHLRKQTLHISYVGWAK